MRSKTRPTAWRSSIPGQTAEVNPALCTLLGFEADELTNMPRKSIPHPDDVDFDRESIPKLYLGRINAYRVEMRLLHTTGRIVHALLSMSPDTPS